MASVLPKSLAGLASPQRSRDALYVRLGGKSRSLVDLATVENRPLQVIVAEDGIPAIRMFRRSPSPIAGPS